jgi:hypothetical protein
MIVPLYVKKKNIDKEHYEETLHRLSEIMIRRYEQIDLVNLLSKSKTTRKTKTTET